MVKAFKTYKEQINYLNKDKNIAATEEDKILLVRNGYFNLVNGYKNPFVAGEMPDGKHVYLEGTTISSLLHVKTFDEKLREHLMKYITKVEQEIRQTFAYRFDFVNAPRNLSWEDEDAFDRINAERFIGVNIRKVKEELDEGKNGYLVHYRTVHDNIPIWIVLKYIKFSTLIDIIKISVADVKKPFCDLYNIETTPRTRDFNSSYDFRVLHSSLLWIRIVRNACAHNERVYGLHRDRRTMTKYHEELGLDRRDAQKMIDLFIFMKYYLSDAEYEVFISDIFEILMELKVHLNEVPYSRIKKSLGIKTEDDLILLLESKNVKEYSKY